MIRQFVSFPKSGRTWIRYMLGQLELDKSIQFHHDQFEFNDGAKPPHDFDLPSRIAHYRTIDRVVYLERDPRDVMVSLYWQVTGRFRTFFNYQGSLGEFIRDDYFGAHNLQRFRLMWAGIVRELGFLAISYEACHADSVATLQRILAYYEFDAGHDALVAAAENATFDKMKAVEQSNSFPEPWLAPRDGFPKVRQGKVGGYRQALTAPDIDYLNSIFLP